MKPFVYAAAFENGAYPGTVVEDSVLDNRAVMIGGTTGILGEWGPESEENRYEGAITARQAPAKSKNAHCPHRHGRRPRLRPPMLGKTAGISIALRPPSATFLGSSAVTLSELALGYTIFPNGGWRPDALHSRANRRKDRTVVWDAQLRAEPANRNQTGDRL
jgi:penicillin-binding protein 1A